MSKQAGLWIDHRRAVVVTVVNGAESTVVLDASHERHAGRFDGTHSRPSHEGMQSPPHDDSQERRHNVQLDGWYDEVIASVHDAESLLIMGPGEAKGELRKRIEKKGHMKAAITVETADKMSDGEVAAKVRHSIADAAAHGASPRS